MILLLTLCLLSIINGYLLWKFIISIKKRNRYFNISLILFNTGVYFWPSLIILSKITNDTEFLHKLIFFAAILCVMGMVGLSFTYPNKVLSRIEKTFFKIVYIYDFVLSAILLGTDFFISDYIVATREVIFNSGKNLLFISFVIQLLFIPIYLTKRYRQEKYQRFYFKYISISLLFNVVILLITNLALPLLLGSIEFTLSGPLTLTLPQLMIFYTISKDELINFRKILNQFFRYFYYVFAIGIVILIFMRTYYDVPSTEDKIIGYFYLSLVGFFLHDVAFSYFYGLQAQSGSELLNNTLKHINENLSISEINKYFINFVVNEYNFKEVYIYKIRGDDSKAILESPLHSISLTDSLYLKHWLEDQGLAHFHIHQNFVINNDVSLDYLKQRNICFLFKYELNNEEYLSIFSGDYQTVNVLTYEDIQKLSTLISSYLVALNRSRLYTQVRNFNKDLKNKIDVATQELQFQKNELEEKYQQEKDMLGILGHELRTPLTVALGNVELIIKKLKSIDTDLKRDQVLTNAERVFDSIVKEREIVETALSTSKIDNGKMNLQVSEFDIRTVINYAVTVYYTEAAKKKLTLKLSIPETVPHAIITDEGKLHEIINNLVSNAIKYTHKGEIRILVDSDQTNIYVHVKDTGEGIPQHELSKLGQKFYRVNQHLDIKNDIVRSGGTGLGLYVVKSYLEVLGGELRIESELGKGSIFTAVIPVRNEKLESLKQTNVSSITNSVDMFEQLGLKR